MYSKTKAKTELGLEKQSTELDLGRVANGGQMVRVFAWQH